MQAAALSWRLSFSSVSTPPFCGRFKTVNLFVFVSLLTLKSGLKSSTGDCICALICSVNAIICIILVDCRRCRPHGDCFICLCDMSDGDGVLLLPCCCQCIHSVCISQFLVSARLNQLHQQTSAADVVRDCCPACKQAVALPPDVAAAVDLTVATALKDAAAAARSEALARAHRDAQERQLQKSQRRQELLDKFTSAPKCCICVRGAHRFQNTKYFMHAFGN
jgi:hypothetical protein